MDRKEIEKKIVETYKLQKKLKKLNEEIAKNKNEIQAFFDSLGKEKQYEVIGKNKKIIALKKERVQLIFNPLKLRENLRHDIFVKVVAVRYYISDLSNFIKMLKSYGVPAKEFKKYMDPDYIPNPYLIKQYYEKGDIEPGELKDTYEAKISKYVELRLSNLEEKNE